MQDLLLYVFHVALCCRCVDAKKNQEAVHLIWPLNLRLNLKCGGIDKQENRTLTVSVKIKYKCSSDYRIVNNNEGTGDGKAVCLEGGGYFIAHVVMQLGEGIVVYSILY